MEYRSYDVDKDRDAAHRIWCEIGWVESDESEKAMDLFLSDARGLVSEIDGAAECLVTSLKGDIRYQKETLPLSIMASVTTGRVARKQGFAGQMTANLIAADAVDGAALSTLGIFEQGFYNRLGYGNGTYEHMVRFDPARLRVGSVTRPPKRLTKDDHAAMHAVMMKRHRGHGSVCIHSASSMQAELTWDDKSFGLGYYDDDGNLSHYLWMGAKGENGPYRVNMTVYQTRSQFLELMAVIKSLGDQVHSVRMREPGGVQMQDLIDAPFRQYNVSDKSDFRADNQAYAYWQMRICDLEACIAATHLCGTPVRFNLELHDPIERYFGDEAAWRGIGGNYVASLGEESAVERGADASLPTLRAGVGAFTRFWLGVRPASGLAMTDEFAAPEDLLDALDELVRLPVPHPDWEY